MPNALAYLVLFSYPLVALLLFRAMPPVRALIWTILAGYLFLPGQTGIDLPLLPAFDKTLIPSLSAAALIWLAARRAQRIERLQQARARRSPAAAGGAAPPPQPEPPAPLPPPSRLRPVSTALVVAMLLLPFATTLTNPEPVGPLPGMQIYDAFSMALNTAVLLLPFLLGRRFLQSPEALRELLTALAWGGLLYIPLILFELRMSPQLNIKLYGFFPHSFLQHVRDGGYRPIVFLEHGLRVSIFLAMACLAALALSRSERPARWRAIALALGVTLVLSKSLGAVLIVLLLAPFLVLAGPRALATLAGSLAALVLAYPMLRSADLVPTGTLLSWAAAISPDRAGSLETRFRNEDSLLAKANQKPLFGWGAWGRSRVQNSDGADVSITDGYWVIVMGVGGWLGYLAEFGLLTLPLLALLRRGRAPPDLLAIGLGLVLAANLVDLLPNSSVSPLLWLAAGTLTGQPRPLAAPARLRADRAAPSAGRRSPAPGR